MVGEKITNILPKEYHDGAHTILYMVAGAILSVLLAAFLTKVGGLVYYTYTPESFFLNVKDFQVEDVNLSVSNYQTWFVDRDAALSIPTYTINELELIRDDTGIVVYTFSQETMFEKGDKIVGVKVPLPKTLEDGKYHWEVALILHLPEGVDRTMSVTSNTFNISH